MANKIPIAIADVELQISTAIGVGDTSFSVSSANDDDGNALPAGYYCFTLDNGTSQKEYLVGQLNGTDVTSVESINRQGTTSSGAARKHRVGAPCIITNFATIRIIEQILRGQEDLDGASPIGYDSEPTLSSRPDLATVGYVLDTVSGGTVAFDSQIITGNAGETVADGDLVYFKTSDQEWYKTDADTVATVEGVQLGIAQGAGSDGAGISGGIQISGTYTTTGLTAGSTYYASNTAGEYGTTAGTTTKTIGVALSDTKLLLISSTPKDLKEDITDALAGGGDFGTPSASNKFLTEELLAGRVVRRQYDLADSPATWTKPDGLKYIQVEAWGGGGNGAGGGSSNRTSAGGGGGYTKKIIEAADLSATETITVGGAATNSTFGSLVTGYRGGNGDVSSSSSRSGGGGGGQLGVGSSGSDTAYVTGGSPGYPSSGYGQKLDPDLPNPPIKHGTFGGGGGTSGFGVAGGNSVYGGGGGGGFSGAGGVSVYGGNGGAGNDSGAGTAGSVPGGGGGAGDTSGGAGGAGRCIVTEYYS